LFKLILIAPSVPLYEAFQEFFDYLPNIEIVNNYFEWLREYGCLISPANSFGMMDGGMDAAITKCFGRELEEKVQQRILDDYLGEQPIGTSMIVKTGHPQHPFFGSYSNYASTDEYSRYGYSLCSNVGNAFSYSSL
jgi:hypothetical protein